MTYTGLDRKSYEEAVAATRDRRMQWWREARFGLFIHYGLYSVLGRHEWAMAVGNYPVELYEQLVDSFRRSRLRQTPGELARKPA